MSAKVQGTAHLYGILGGVGILTGVTVNSVRLKNFPGVKGKVENELGQAIERRYDDQTNEADIEVTLRSGYSIPAGDGSLFTYNSIAYEIQSTSKAETKKGYQTLTLTVMNSSQITPA